MNPIKKNIKRIPFLGPISRRIYLFLSGNSFKGSANYWEQNYKAGGTSGEGSYSRLAEFKAEILNSFVLEKKISSVLEFGSGDGNQLSLAKYPSYIGLDVAASALKICISKYKTDKSKSFYMYNSFAFQDHHKFFKTELTISLDVIYHLIEDDIFDNYMSHLFQSSTRYVIVYASNCEKGNEASHVKSRKFTDWVEKNMKNWQLIEKIDNKYKFDPKDPNNTSISDFYIYKKNDEILF